MIQEQEIANSLLHFHNIEKAFQKFLLVKNYTSNLQHRYFVEVQEYFSFLKRQGYTSLIVTNQNVRDYFSFLTTRNSYTSDQPLSIDTVNSHLSSLRIFFQFLLDSGRCTSAPLVPQNLRVNKVPKEILTLEEMRAMYSACENRTETALLSLAYGCGLRRSEMANLKLSDINLSKGFLIVTKGKGSKRREVPMSEKVITDLKDYIYNERQADPNKRILNVMINSNGLAMTGQHMNNMVRHIAKRVPMLINKNITLHSFRRSIATHLMDNGADIHFVQEFLGHTEINTSQLYAIRRKRKIKIT